MFMSSDNLSDYMRPGEKTQAILNLTFLTDWTEIRCLDLHIFHSLFTHVRASVYTGKVKRKIIH